MTYKLSRWSLNDLFPVPMGAWTARNWRLPSTRSKSR